MDLHNFTGRVSVLGISMTLLFNVFFSLLLLFLPVAQAVSADMSQKQLDSLTQQSANKPLILLDASEIQLDGAGTMALTFSIPLDPQQDFKQWVHLVDTKSGIVDGGWELSPNLKVLWFRNLPPNRELRVSVEAGLRALNKVTFAESWKQTIETKDIKPGVGFTSRGSLLPQRAITGLPVVALNVNSVDVNFFRVKAESLPAFIREWQVNKTGSYWHLQELLSMMDLVYTGRFDINPPRNVRENTLLPINNIKQLQQPGVYVAVMQAAGEYNYYHAITVFTLSDIGISLHKYGQRADLFIQSLADGAPKANVTLRFLDKKGQTVGKVVTGRSGFATFDSLHDAVLVLANDQQHSTMLDLTAPALDLSEFQLSGGTPYQKQFFMFGPRDLYRPGETILLNALLRDPDGKPLPSQPVKLQVIQPDGTVVRTLSWQPKNGLYQFNWPLAKSAPAGLWQFLVDTGDSQQQQWQVHVEDFQPERMALELHADITPGSTAFTDFAGFSINGRYLYGAPAANSEVLGQLYLRPLREAVSARPGFEFGNIDEGNLFHALDQVVKKLNDQGEGRISVDEWPQVKSPVNLILQASLLESGGRPVTRRVEQAIWPVQVLAGIRPLFNKKPYYNYISGKTQSLPMVDVNSNAEFEIVYSNVLGELNAVQGLSVRLIHERRNDFWHWSNGNWKLEEMEKDIPVSEQTLDLIAGQVGKVSFLAQEWGTYRLEVTDPDGNMSSIRFRAGYNWQDNGDGSGSGTPRPDQVMLKIDKPFYNAGDNVKVHIAAPMAGKGYLIVESSNGPLWWQPIDVPEKGLDISVPLDKRWQRHDLYLSALVVRQPDARRAATIKRAVGILYLPIGDASRQLNLVLDTPQKMRPNQPLKVKIKATAQHGKLPDSINVLVSAVDSGILNITNYRTPDPWNAFMGRKKYTVDIYDIYNQVIEGQGRKAALRFGGDGEDPLAKGSKKPPSHVRILAQQAQPVQLDANGEGSVTLPIDDFNGEVRVMAQAWSDDRFASAQSMVTVAEPVVVQLSTPRFMAAGDSAQLALDINNLTDRPQTLSLTAKASGLITISASVQHIQLAPHTRHTLTVPIVAKQGYGDGVLNMLVDGVVDDEQQSAAVTFSVQKQWKIGVRPAFPAQTVSIAKTLAPGEAWQIPPQLLNDLQPDTIQGRLLLSGKPPINIGHYVAELKAYPYGCLEQTTSGLYPSLYSSSEQLKQLGIIGGTEQQRQNAMTIGISRLLGMQLQNGGFAMWDSKGEEQYWLTVYATDFLNRAKEQGYEVPGEALNQANQRLVHYLQDRNTIDVAYSQNEAASQFAVQAYAALVLARQQQVPLGTLRTLWKWHADAGSGLSLVQLGIALKLMGDAPRATEAISLGLNTARTTLWIGDYGSSLRDDALILSLLAENHELFSNKTASEWQTQQNTLLSQVSGDAWSKPWLSTQQNNALYLAGRALLNVPDHWQAATSLSTTLLQSDKPRTQILTEKQLQSLTVTNKGNDALWLQLDNQGYPAQAPAAYSNVLHISRRAFSMKTGQAINMKNLHSGELVLIWLQVRADKTVPDALVVDLLPAGLELENQNLADSSASLQDTLKRLDNTQLSVLLDNMQRLDIQYIDYLDDRFVASLPIRKNQTIDLLYLARAVTPGVYRIPAPMVESMYIPDWRAIGGPGDKVTITPAK